MPRATKHSIESEIAAFKAAEGRIGDAAEERWRWPPGSREADLAVLNEAERERLGGEFVTN